MPTHSHKSTQKKQIKACNPKPSQYQAPSANQHLPIQTPFSEPKLNSLQKFQCIPLSFRYARQLPLIDTAAIFLITILISLLALSISFPWSTSQTRIPTSPGPDDGSRFPKTSSYVLPVHPCCGSTDRRWVRCASPSISMSWAGIRLQSAAAASGTSF